MIKRLLISFIVVFSIVIALQPILEKGLHRFDLQKFEKLDEIILGKTPYDLVVFGSSRAYVHYHPGILDTLLHLNTFNAGSEGALYGETDVLLMQYLKHHPKPRVVLVNTDMAMFAYPDRIFNPTSYYPYLTEPAVKEYLHKMDPFSKGISYLPFLAITRYDDYLRGNSIKGIFGKTASYSRFHYKGYIESPETQIIDTLKSLPPSNQDSLYTEAFSFFSKWDSICRKQDIQFIAVFSPYHQFNYKSYPKQVSRRKIIKQGLREAGIEVLDMETPSFSGRIDYFSDAIHLNRKGARLFSSMLADSLKMKYGF